MRLFQNCLWILIILMSSMSAKADVVLTEVLNGAGNAMKLIEVYNNSDQEVSLDGYTVLFSNTDVPLDGKSLAGYQSLVVYHKNVPSGELTALQAACDSCLWHEVKTLNLKNPTYTISLKLNGTVVDEFSLDTKTKWYIVRNVNAFTPNTPSEWTYTKGITWAAGKISEETTFGLVQNDNKIVAVNACTSLGYGEGETKKSLYVDGNAASTQPTGATDAPFSSLSDAYDAAAQVLEKCDDLESLSLVFLPGTYSVESSLVLDSTFNANNIPLTFKADASVTDDSPVVFSGATSLDGLTPLASLPSEFEDALADSTVAANIVAVDLTGAGIVDSVFDEIEDHGYSGLLERDGAVTTMLYSNSQRMTLARWPDKNETSGFLADSLDATKYLGQVSVSAVTNKGVVPTNSAPNGVGGQFEVGFSERAKKWQGNDMFVSGVLSAAWVYTYNKIASISEEGDSFTMARGEMEGGIGGSKPLGQKQKPTHFHIENVAEEITQPGEFYLDRDSKVLYFYPLVASTSQTTDGLSITSLSEPMFDIEGASNITFDGIQFSGGRHSAIIADATSSNITIKDCKIENFGLHAVVMDASNSVIDNCTITGTGASAVKTAAGTSTRTTGNASNGTLAIEFNSIVNGNVVFKNNVISDFGWDQKSQQAGIEMSGTGNRAERNTISYGPHFGIELRNSTGNQIVENYIHDVAQFIVEDGGAIYFGIGNFPYMRGNVVDGNVIRNVASSGVYIDNFSSGVTVSNNIFDNVGNFKSSFSGVNINGGGQNLVEFNTFHNVERAVKYNKFAANTLYANYEDKIKIAHTEFNANQAFKDEYVAAFPDFQTFLDVDASAVEAFKYQSSTVRNNVTYNSDTDKANPDNADDYAVNGISGPPVGVVNNWPATHTWETSGNALIEKDEANQALHYGVFEHWAPINSIVAASNDNVISKLDAVLPTYRLHVNGLLLSHQNNNGFVSLNMVSNPTFKQDLAYPVPVLDYWVPSSAKDASNEAQTTTVAIAENGVTISNRLSSTHTAKYTLSDVKLGEEYLIKARVKSAGEVAMRVTYRKTGEGSDTSITAIALTQTNGDFVEINGSFTLASDVDLTQPVKIFPITKTDDTADIAMQFVSVAQTSRSIQQLPVGTVNQSLSYINNTGKDYWTSTIGGKVLDVMRLNVSDVLVDDSDTTNYIDIKNWIKANPTLGWRFAEKDELEGVANFFIKNPEAYIAFNGGEWTALTSTVTINDVEVDKPVFNMAIPTYSFDDIAGGSQYNKSSHIYKVTKDFGFGNLLTVTNTGCVQETDAQGNVALDGDGNPVCVQENGKDKADNSGEGASTKRTAALLVRDVSVAFDLNNNDIVDALELDDESDVDSDGVNNGLDAMVLDPSETSDMDNDGFGDNVDVDRDGDSYANASDLFPEDATEWANLDGDEFGDNIDTDKDGDGFDNINAYGDGVDEDAFPTDANEWADFDKDGKADNLVDNDDDNDGKLDINDPFPLDASADTDTDSDGRPDVVYVVELVDGVEVRTGATDDDSPRKDLLPDDFYNGSCPFNAVDGATYVNANYSGDSEINNKEKPFNSLNAALLAHATNGVITDTTGLTIYLRAGEYHESVDSLQIIGDANAPVTISAYLCEDVKFTGLRDVADISSGDWQQLDNNAVNKIYQREIDRPVWQLFRGSDDTLQEQMVARWPNAVFDVNATNSVYSKEVWAEGQDDKEGVQNGTLINQPTGTDEHAAYHDLANAKDHNNQPLNVQDAIVIANTASFYTYSRKILTHTAESNEFTHEPTSKYKSKHNSFFIEGKLELLDSDNEWHYQTVNGKHMVYVRSESAPSDTIKVRSQAYAIDVSDWKHVDIKNIDFNATSLRCNDCEDIRVEGGHFQYSATSQRLLQQADQYNGYGNNSFIHLKSDAVQSGMEFINNQVTDTGVQALVVEGGNSVIKNNLFLRLDWSAADTYGPHATVMLMGLQDQKGEFSYNTMDQIGNSTMFVPESRVRVEPDSDINLDARGSIHALYNRFMTGGFAQNDGSSIQLRVGQQSGTNIAYNWAHDSTKYGIRFDAPNPIEPDDDGGQYGLIHHNVVWNAMGIMVKGDDHRVYHNTTFDNADVDLRMLTEASNDNYNHDRSIVANNASDSISSDRKVLVFDESDYNGGNGVDRNNFNGDHLYYQVNKVSEGLTTETVTGKSNTLKEQLRDPDNYDFRPKLNSYLHNRGSDINSPNSYAGYDDTTRAALPVYDEAEKVGELDLGAYELNSPYYWIPGYRQQKASFPIPLDELTDTSASGVGVGVNLMWREAYQADSYKLYVSTDRADLEGDTPQSSSAIKVDKTVFDHGLENIAKVSGIDPTDATKTPRLAQGVYYWRVDAINGDKVIAGDIWQFTVLAFTNTDGDSKADQADIFPKDETETVDSDYDGVGDNADVLPNDATEQFDSDNDGLGDNADVYPLSPYHKTAISPVTPRLDLGDNLVANGHFETVDLSNWTLSASATPQSTYEFESYNSDGDNITDSDNPIAAEDSANASAPKDTHVLSFTSVAGVAATIYQKVPAVDATGGAQLVAGQKYRFAADLRLPSEGNGRIAFVYKYKTNELVDATDPESEKVTKTVVLEPTGDATTPALFTEKAKWARYSADFAMAVDFVSDFEFWFKVYGKSAFKVDNVALYSMADSDQDGIVDAKDAYDNDASAYLDSDGDGVADQYYQMTSGKLVDSNGVITAAVDSSKVSDAFPDDASADTDTDNDGVADIYYELDQDNVRTGNISTTQQADIDVDGNGVIDAQVLQVTAPATLTVEAVAAGAALDLSGLTATFVNTSGLTAVNPVITNNALASYTKGQYQVEWTVTVSLQNGDEVLTATATDTQAVNVIDSTAPVFAALEDLLVFTAANGKADVTLVAPSAVDGIDGTITATADFDNGSYAIGDYVITWTATDTSGNSATATQALTIETGYTGSIVSDTDSYNNDVAKDYYHVYDLNGENLHIMRLSASDDVAGDNADLATVNAWLADNTEWQYASLSQLSNLVNFFEDDVATFASFNGGWADGEQWTAIGQDASGAQITLAVNSTTFGNVAVTSGVDSNATDAAVLLVRRFVDSDADGVRDAADAYPNDYRLDTDADNDGYPAQYYKDVDGVRTVDTAPVLSATDFVVDFDDNNADLRFDSDNDGIADNGLGENDDLCVGPEIGQDGNDGSCAKWTVYFTLSQPVVADYSTETTSTDVVLSELEPAITIGEDDNGNTFDLNQVTRIDLSVNGTSVDTDQTVTLNAGSNTVTFVYGYADTSFTQRITVNVTVTDSGKPVITADSVDATIEAEGLLTAVRLSAEVVDNIDTALKATYSVENQDGVLQTDAETGLAATEFAVGEYTVTWTVSDAADNTAAPVTQSFAVVDTVLPVITVADNITLEATAALTPVTIESALATDTVAGDLTVSSDAKATYPVGVHTITWTAFDGSNTATAEQIVTITDSTMPVIEVTAIPAVIEATGATTAVAFGTVSASDIVDGDISDNITSDSKATYGVGEHTVTWSVSDSAGNPVSVSQTFTVKDTVSPVFATLGPISDFAPVVLPTVTANDNVDGAIVATSDFAGTTAGAYTVTWTAVDASGNTNTTTQSVTILSLSFDDVSVIADKTVEASGETTPVDLPQSIPVSGGLFAATADFRGPFVLGDNVISWSATIAGGDTIATTQTITIVDTTAPIFTDLAPVTLAAKGSLTKVNGAVLGQAVAQDDVSGELTAEIISSQLLPSGQHDVTWQVADASGNTATATQVVMIEPRVSFGANAFSEAGSTSTVDILLSGEAPVYPVTVSLVLASDATGHSATATDVVIESGLSGSVSFDIPADTTLVAGDKVELNIASATNAVLGRKLAHNTTLIQGNEAPIVKVNLTANGKKTKIVTTGSDDTVVLTAKVRDINRNDSHSIEWTLNGLVDLALDTDPMTVEVSLSDVTAGRYVVSATATEDTSEGLQSSASLLFVVKDAPVVLAATQDTDNDGVSDADEGLSDSDGDGIADFKDNNDDTSVLPLTADSELVMQTDSGLSLQLGKTVIAAKAEEADGAVLAIEDLVQFGGVAGDSTENAQDDEFQVLSQIVDFEIAELPRAGISVSVILPLPAGVTLPENAIYRKYDSVDGWANFLVDDVNRLASSALVDGVCPDTSSDSYTDGLNAGDSCVRITIQDGGEYDQDGEANGVVVDPGAVVVMKTAYVKANVAPYNALAEGQSMTLSATTSEGAELQYEWTQVSGMTLALEANGDSVTVSAPFVDEVQSVELQLRVYNDNFEDTILLPVTVSKVASQVTASLTGNESVFSGETVLLNALSSTDEQGLALNYRWQQRTGPLANLENTDEGNIYFIAPKVTSETQLTFAVIVSNGESTDIATYVVTVKPVQQVVVNESVSDSSGGLPLYIILGLAMMTIQRRRYLR